ncbi:DNA-binding response regulator [Reinekea marinisedimentorum]|uniref:Regulatory LuxR family protein n=1 Tax=Reinekea marinisedimentorum TaxID=230495 RepID=A0A4R3I0F6_9GAMM|nr:DNA-binding response regulator [Reinekea marinisedimentorum]TCS39008.1 regulatory LuxR family protein [Reinekea marinisedimentorum]
MNIIKSNNIIVLVVDDSPESLGMLNAALNEAGLTVLVALNGMQALSIVEKVQPDVILLDGVMPEMDGFDTCQKLKEKLPSTPVIFMTGLNDSEHVVRGFEVGGVDYITKPVVPSEVLARIRTHSHNAKLAKSAQAALDYAGQYIFCVSVNGELEWATPHAQELIGSLQEDLVEKWAHIKPAIAQWLAGNERDTPLTLPEMNEPLHAEYAGDYDQLHSLIRLVKPKQLGTEADLQQALNVTKRESQVLYWLSFGKTNWEIATILEMSPRTVNKHLEQIYKKLEVDNRTAAASSAIRILESS